MMQSRLILLPSLALLLIGLAACQKDQPQTTPDSAGPVYPPGTSLYATRPGVTDYWHPFRAQVEESGQLMTCTGFVGRDERGNLILSLHPTDFRMSTGLGGEPMLVQWWMLQEGNGEAFFLQSYWANEGASVLSSLAAMTSSGLHEDGSEGLMKTFLVHDLPSQPIQDANGKDWRVSLEGGTFEEVLILGQGGPWKERPPDAFRILEEPEPGSFTLDGVPLIKPLWNILDWREEGTPSAEPRD